MKNIKIFNQISKLHILIFSLTVLVLLYIISFINPVKSEKHNIITTALVNPKYEISEVNIYHKDFGNLSLHNYSDFWGGEFFNNQDYIYFPADSKLVNDFIKNVKQVIELDKITQSKKDVFPLYNLTDDAVVVSFYDNDKNCISKIYFGALNKTMDKIFLRTDRNISVYAMDSKIVDFLDPSIKNWTEQNIIPQGISHNLEYSKIQNFTYTENNVTEKAGEKAKEKITSLRFSEILTDFSAGTKTLELNIAEGNGSEYRLSFYPAVTRNGDCYIYDINIKPAITYSENQKEFIKKLNYSGAISQWTYSSITEVLRAE